MPENDKKAPRVINKSGTLKMDDKLAATKETRDVAGRKMDRRNRRDRVRPDAAPKEFDEITIENIDLDFVKTITTDEIYEFFNYTVEYRKNKAKARGGLRVFLQTSCRPALKK
jgi:hypothetical protein